MRSMGEYVNTGVGHRARLERAQHVGMKERASTLVRGKDGASSKACEQEQQSSSGSERSPSESEQA